MTSSLEPVHPGVASARLYQAPDGSKYPRLQILTVAELLEGKRISLPA